MTKSMMLRLDSFGRQALTDFTEERHDSAGAALRTASLYYLADRDSGRPAWQVPKFLHSSPETGTELKIDVDDETWAALDRAAREQGIDPERLAEHALLYYLADLDGGKLAERVGGAVDKRGNAPK
jgi:cobalamin biosynthesis protein CbiG